MLLFVCSSLSEMFSCTFLERLVGTYPDEYPGYPNKIWKILQFANFPNFGQLAILMEPDFRKSRGTISATTAVTRSKVPDGAVEVRKVCLSTRREAVESKSH